MAKMLLREYGRDGYASTAQIDAVAVSSFSSSGCATHRDDDDDDDDDGDSGAAASETPLLAVAQSQLEGNQWSGFVTLVDARTHEQHCGFQLSTGVSALAWCGIDGNVLALACDNGDVQLVKLSDDDSEFVFVPQQGGSNGSNDDERDADSNAPTASFGWGHDDVVAGISASRFEKTKLATSSWDLTVKLWDISSMDKTVATLEGHTDLVWSVAMNQQVAHVLASASQDCTVQVWDDRQSTDAVLAVSTVFSALAVDWHPHKETLFSTGLEDGSILTFDTRSPHTPLSQSATHDGPVHALKYSRFHEDLLASGGDDASVFITEGGSQSSSTRVDSQHHDYVRALEWFECSSSAASAKNSTCLATGSWDKTLRTWSVEPHI